MLIKATQAFVGEVSMVPEQVQDVPDEVAKDLIQAGYAVAGGATVPPTPVVNTPVAPVPEVADAKPTTSKTK